MTKRKQKYRDPKKEGISAEEFFTLFPDEESAVKYVERLLWNGHPRCPRCGGTERIGKGYEGRPYRCLKCGRFFGVKMGTLMEGSHIPFRKWLYAIRMMINNRKGVPALLIAKELRISANAAWFLAHRIRYALIGDESISRMDGNVEADKAFMGGLERNKHENKKLRAGRGSVGKTAVLGIVNRATGEVRMTVLEGKRGESAANVRAAVAPGAVICTDEDKSFSGLSDDYEHIVLKHKVGEYLRGNATTNGVESVWARLKRSHYGIHHKMSPEYLEFYVNEGAFFHARSGADPHEVMASVVRRLAGRRLRFKDMRNGEARQRKG